MMQQPEQCPHALRESFTICNSYEECPHQVFDSMNDDVFCKKGAQPPAPDALHVLGELESGIDKAVAGMSAHEDPVQNLGRRKAFAWVKMQIAVLRARERAP